MEAILGLGARGSRTAASRGAHGQHIADDGDLAADSFIVVMGGLTDDVEVNLFTVIFVVLMSQ